MSIFDDFNEPVILSSVRMESGDMFEVGSELCIALDTGRRNTTDTMWCHHFRLATKEEQITYEVMQS
jgi:predicted RecA/RadA family phage recombinase